jgi:hypothetical protein
MGQPVNLTWLLTSHGKENQSKGKGKDKVICVLNYVIKHYTMKAYGGMEV